MQIDLRDHSPARLISRSAELGVSAAQLRRLMGSVIGQGVFAPEQWTQRAIISKERSQQFLEMPRLRVDKIVTSATDGFSKILFRTEQDLPLETVIIPLQKSAAVTICLSSQVGCVMGCAFCATAKMSSRKNLATWEIVDQFIQARALAQASGKKVTGAVFMGMGEPFLNYERVMAAAELLCYPVRNAISARAITVSTVGLVDEIDKFTLENRPFRLSISLGAATDEKRKKIVPIAARTPLKELMAAARRYSIARRDRVNLAYVCISGENVSESDAEALGELIGDTKVRLDLIDVNDSSGRFLPPSEAELSQFRDALRRYVGQPVARRYSGGSDIRAACGTLAGI